MSSIRRSVVIHAPSVHAGGGLVLLQHLLSSITAPEIAALLLDERAKALLRVPAGARCLWFAPTLEQRFAAERALRAESSAERIVLCFGALPPLFPLRASTSVFMQNRNIAQSGSLRRFGVRVGARIALERSWLRLFARHADEFVVQTPAMAELLRRTLGSKANVRVLAFGAMDESVSRRAIAVPADGAQARFDFIYVASGDAHKNHERLLDAWCLLAREGVFPRLCLTLDVRRFGALCARVADCIGRHGLKIENVGVVEHEALQPLYRAARALIFPSLSESLGLPLIEARRHGIPVVASEADVVRDVLDPEESFDPTSAISIARAVKRFLGRRDPDFGIVSARRFLDELDARAPRRL